MLKCENCQAYNPDTLPPDDYPLVLCLSCGAGPLSPVGDDFPWDDEPRPLVLDLAELPSRDLESVLRYSATLARGAGMRRYEVKVGRDTLKVLPL